LLHDSTGVQPLVTGWWFRYIGSAQHVRPSGIRCRWPDDPQRSARLELCAAAPPPPTECWRRAGAIFL